MMPPVHSAHFPVVVLSSVRGELVEPTTSPGARIEGIINCVAKQIESEKQHG
jgi:hypothetical protein